MTLRSRLSAHCSKAGVWHVPLPHGPEWVKRFQEFGAFMNHAFEKSPNPNSSFFSEQARRSEANLET